jgi:hypothetical protein
VLTAAGAAAQAGLVAYARPADRNAQPHSQSLTSRSPPHCPPLKGIEIEVKGRRVRVKGPRGVLHRDFRHLAVDMFLVEEEGEKKLNVRPGGGGLGRARGRDLPMDQGAAAERHGEGVDPGRLCGQGVALRPGGERAHAPRRGSGGGVCGMRDWAVAEPRPL